MGVAVGPGSAYNINCNSCGPICNIEITVTEYDGIPIASTTVDMNSGPASLPTGPPCNATSIAYDSSTFNFVIS
jgi:hypothetical protein